MDFIFAIAATILSSAIVLLLIQRIQRTWDAKSETFAKRFPRLIKEAAGQLMEAEEAVNRYRTAVQVIEERADTLDLRLHVIRDLVDVSTQFIDHGPLQETDFRRFIGNIVLAATQALLPTHVDTRARLMVFDGSQLRQYAAFVTEKGMAFSGHSFEVGEGAVGLCFETRQSILVSDTWSDPLFRGSGKPKYRSVLCVPVCATTANVIGVLNVDAPEVNCFNEEHAELLSTAANVIYSIWTRQNQCQQCENVETAMLA